MKNYYVNLNAQPNGDHEVHAEGCTYMPSAKKYLGLFSTCHGAVAEAKKTYSKSNGCYFCAPLCHTT